MKKKIKKFVQWAEEIAERLNLKTHLEKKFKEIPSISIDFEKEIYNFPNLKQDCAFIDSDKNWDGLSNKLIYSNEYPEGIKLVELLEKRFDSIKEDIFENDKFSDQLLVSYMIKRAKEGCNLCAGKLAGLFASDLYLSPINIELSGDSYKIVGFEEIGKNFIDINGRQYIKNIASWIYKVYSLKLRRIDGEEFGIILLNSAIKIITGNNQVAVKKILLKENVEQYEIQVVSQKTRNITLGLIRGLGDYLIKEIKEIKKIKTRKEREERKKDFQVILLLFSNPNWLTNIISKTNLEGKIFYPNSKYSLKDFILGRKGIKSPLREMFVDWLKRKDIQKLLKIRSSTRSLESILGEDKEGEPILLEDTVPDKNPNPLEQIIAKEESKKIWTAKEVKKRQKAIIDNFGKDVWNVWGVVNAFNNPSIREIAQRTKISKSKIGRILKSCVLKKVDDFISRLNNSQSTE